MNSRSIIQNSLRGAQYFILRFQEDRCSEIAAALVYMSLFALVPLITVVFAVGSAIPTSGNIEQQIQQFLVQNLVPEASRDVADYLATFSEQAKNLTGFGVAILLVTAVLMLRNVERAFNNIWRTRKNRSPIGSFLLYWAVLSLAPLLLGIGLGIQAYLYAAANAIAGFDTLGISMLLLSLLPFVITVVGLTALYMAVPNCAVPARHALVGGLVTAIAFTIARVVFALVIANSSYTLVYGAFAAVPVFLLWLYVMWILVLLGAILVHSLSAYQTKLQATRPRLLKALDVLYLLWQRQQQGEPVGELELLRDPIVIGGLDSGSWQVIRDRLIDTKLLTEDHQGRYLLSCDLSNVTLVELKQWINDELPVPPAPLSAKDWQRHAVELLERQRHSQADLLKVSITDLFKGVSSGSGHGSCAVS